MLGYDGRLFIPFPTLVVSETTSQSHFGPYRRPLSCGPRTPVQSAYGLGAGYSMGFIYLEVPRPHLASLDDPRGRWPLP